MPWAAITTRLDKARPLAVLVATPAFCQTATCDPGLDILGGPLAARAPRGWRPLIPSARQ